MLVIIPVGMTAQDEARLLRFPAIHDDQIVFGLDEKLYRHRLPLVTTDSAPAVPDPETKIPRQPIKSPLR